MSKDHVALLVFGVFNASMPRDDTSSKLKVGTEVALKVTGMDVQSLPIMINAQLGDGKKLDGKTKKRAREQEQQQEQQQKEEQEQEQEQQEEIKEEPTKTEEKHKKKRKHKHKKQEEEQEEEQPTKKRKRADKAK